jgi:hypothetical protein
VSQRRWKVRVVLASLLVPLALLVVTPARLATWVGRRRPSGDPPPPDADLAEWTDRVLGRLPPPWRRTCLRRSLVLYYLLRRAGRPAVLHLGVRRDPAGVLDAHAWLSRDGAPLLEPAASHATSYRILASFPPAPMP